jgi:hypothetical protein
VFTLAVAGKAGYVRMPGWGRAFSVGIWIIFAFFVLNTAGNLASSVPFEKFVFAPITLVLSLLAFRLAISKGGEQPKGIT